jgi:uncharacterized membrane protein YdjX (TVP38/TMEM64 family)
MMTAMIAEPKTNAASANRSNYARILPLLVLLAVPVASYALGLNRVLSLDLLAQYHGALKTWIADHRVSAVAGFIALYAIVTALSLPAGALVTISGGLLFGWIVGGPAAIVGATIGATLLFLIARSSLGSGLVKQAGPWLEKLSEGFQKDAFNYLLFLRLVPAIPFVIVNLVPAVLGMDLWSYVVATFVGIIPGTLAYAYVGTGLESVITAATQSYQACLIGKGDVEAAACKISIDAGKLVTPEIVIALAGLALVSLLPIAIKRFANRAAGA